METPPGHTAARKLCRQELALGRSWGGRLAWGNLTADGNEAVDVGAFFKGNTCTPMVDSSQGMAKPIQYCKVK